MKLYFMIGLPTEQDEDVRGIVETGARVRNVGFNYHRKHNVSANVSVSSHVPKPHTPFQWCAMDSIEELHRKQKLLSETAREHRLRVKWHDVKTSYIEGVIARGDYPVAEAVFLAWSRGARFDGWDECLDFDSWVQAFEDAGIEAGKYLGTFPLDGVLPWDHIHIQLEEGFLKREYRRAVRNQLSPTCGKPVWAKVHHTNVEDAEKEKKKLVCYHCGVECDMTAMKEDRIVNLKKLNALKPQAPEPTNPQMIELARKNKTKAKSGPPPRKDQGPGYPLRLWFTKLGNVRLTSHLDMVRKLPRIFRRAGIGLKTSEGFNPKPLMTFSSALPLGTWSMEEIADVQTLLQWNPRRWWTLNQVTPTGLHFLRGESLEKGGRRFQLVAASLYHIRLPEGLGRMTSPAVDSKMGQPQWLVERRVARADA